MVAGILRTDSIYSTIRAARANNRLNLRNEAKLTMQEAISFYGSHLEINVPTAANLYCHSRGTPRTPADTGLNPHICTPI